MRRWLAHGRCWLTVAALALTAASGRAQPASPSPSPAFDLSIEAPAPLDAFLLRHAELSRFRELADLTPSELERLVAQASKNLRHLLGTLGYFDPSVNAHLTLRPGQSPLIQVQVEPGPPTRIALVQITLLGAAQDHPEAGEQRLALHRDWGLPVGEVFTQSAWDAAKNRTLRTLSEKRFPRARIVNSLAHIVREEHQANLYLEVDSGPAYRFGEIVIEGAERYDAEMARRLVQVAGVRAGQTYQEALLQAAQRRLTESGYYPSAFVLLAPEGDPQHHPVIARVREAPLQKVVVGLGASTDRGPRLTLEYTHHQLPQLGWRGVSRLQWERDTATLGLNLTAPIDAKGWRWVTGAEAERQDDRPRITITQQWRLGQSQETPTLDRSFFMQLDRSVSRDARLLQAPQEATSVSANYTWTRRRLDDLTAPQRGHALGVELGAGVTLTEQRQPYLRSRVRWLAYWPVAEASDRPSRLALRLDGGAVWARDGTPVPLNQRFLAGGDNSVRGYATREIGVPLAVGGVEAGKWLSVASLEWQRPIWRNGQRTAWESTVFIDAGAVANRPSALSPQIGIGTGVRFNSPVGPLQADLAYGLESQRLRLHLSVGFAF